MSRSQLQFGETGRSLICHQTSWDSELLFPLSAYSCTRHSLRASSRDCGSCSWLWGQGELCCMGIQDVEWDKLLLIKPQQDMKGHFPRHPNGAGCHTPMEKPKYLVVNSSLALWRSRIDPKQPKVRHPELLTMKFFGCLTQMALTRASPAHDARLLHKVTSESHSEVQTYPPRIQGLLMHQTPQADPCSLFIPLPETPFVHIKDKNYGKDIKWVTTVKAQESTPHSAAALVTKVTGAQVINIFSFGFNPKIPNPHRSPV